MLTVTTPGGWMPSCGSASASTARADALEGDAGARLGLLGQEHQELFAAVAVDLVAAPQALGDRAGHGAEGLVAGEVAVMVVVALEVIDVAERGGVGVAVARHAGGAPRGPRADEVDSRRASAD